MDKKPALTLKNIFLFNGKEDLYEVLFYGHYLNIKSENENIKIEYSKIHKIKYTPNKIKIIIPSKNINNNYTTNLSNSDGNNNFVEIKIPCSVNDITKVKTLFKIYNDSEPKEIFGSAIVFFGEFVFLININSTDIKILKSNILKRVAKFIYPSCYHEDLSFDFCKNICFTILIEEKYRIEIITNEDLEAALRYFQNKIKLYVHLNQIK